MATIRYCALLSVCATILTAAPMNDHKVTLRGSTTNISNVLSFDVQNVDSTDDDIGTIYHLTCALSESLCVTLTNDTEYILKSEVAGTSKCAKVALYQATTRVGLYCIKGDELISVARPLKQSVDFTVTCTANP